MRTKPVLIMLVVLLVVMIFIQGAGAMQSDYYTLDWYTLLDSAGGGPASSTHYQANFTIGQTAEHTSSSANYQVGLGYWFNELREWLLHLPLILKDL